MNIVTQKEKNVFYKQMRKPTGNQNPYLVQKIMTASPEQLIVYIFDAGIAACGQENKVKSMQAVQELINSLNFDHKPVAATFYSMYRYILDQLHQMNFEEAKKMLTELRQAWVKAFNLS